MTNQAANSGSRTRAYIGLGSNQGDRVGFVQQAMQLLKDVPGIEIIECSSLYETEPIGRENSQWFVNGVSAVNTDLTAEELLAVCQDIESRLTELYGLELSQSCLPDTCRIIDLDVLFYDDQQISTDYLTVPHPHIHERAFALVPLLEIAPDVVHPGLGKTVTQLHEALQEPELVFLYGLRGMEQELE